MQLSRDLFWVCVIVSWSVFQLRLSGGTVDLASLSDAAAPVDAGDAVPLGVCLGESLDLWLAAGEPPTVTFCLLTSLRHFETISLDKRATSGDLCCLSLLTMIPIFVERRRSSVGRTPFCSSLSNDINVAGVSPDVAAFVNALDLNSISLTSMLRTRDIGIGGLEIKAAW